MTLVDTHCHLHRQEFDSDRRQVVARAKQAGVEILLDPATDLGSNPTVVELARQIPEVYAAVGVHPHDAAELTDSELKEMTLLADHPKVVAVGEIGLDYYRNLSPPEVQQEAFRKLLQTADRLKRPVILHCREAYPDLFAILRESFQPPIRGVLHCFSGGMEEANQGLALGLYLSFAGNLTFPKADRLREVAKAISLEKILLETDAPFLAPQAFRGKRNEPAYLPQLVQTWAEIRGVTPEELARITTANARKLFGIPGSS